MRDWFKKEVAVPEFGRNLDKTSTMRQWTDKKKKQQKKTKVIRKRDKKGRAANSEGRDSHLQKLPKKKT